MNRTLKLSIMLALAAGGGHAMAQNLGPAQVRSTIDQPLVADIPITGMTGNTADIHVALASPEAFSRAGLNRDGLPVALSFAVTKGASGQPVVRVTSSEPIRDTYLDFLIEVNTGGNKVVREVTMLLDPPGSTPSVPSANVAAGTRPSRTSDVPSRVPHDAQPSRAETPPPAAPVPAPSRAEPAAPAPRSQGASRASAPSAASASQIGPVKRGETLSAIARDHADGADINQMLVALQKANPDAFYRDNINALKTGAVLRIPSADDVKAQSAAAALTEVRRQNEAWRSGAARSPAVVADAASTGAAPAKAPSPTSGDRLALVPAKEGGDAASTRAGSKNASGDAQVAGLKQELATSQESVASLRQQSDELKSRVADLEAIKTKNERLISLKDSEIAELQRKLAEAGKAPATTAAVASAPAPAASAAPVAAMAQAASVAAASAPKAESTAGEPATTVTTTPLKEPAAAPSQATKPTAPPHPTPHAATAPVEEETPWFMQPWAWGAGGVVVLLLLLALFSRRKKPAVAKAAPLAAPSLADQFGDEPRFDGIDGIDPDQREILDALAEHPDDIGLHLELVSLYYGRGDVDHFEAAAEAMYAHISDPDQPEWRDVVAMGQELAPTHPLFGGVPGDPIEDDEYEAGTYTASTPRTAHEAAALEEFDLGHYVTGAEDDEHAVPAPQKHSEYHFNFDLTPVQRAEAETRPNAPDVFDVDAPESPYVEPHDTHVPAFGDVLAEETKLPEDRQTWSFDDVPETPVHPIRTESHLDVPHVDEPPRFDEPHFLEEEPVALDSSPEGFSDDPVDTKLDLARAYLDMGDAEGARLMLEEVIAEGSQMQKDTAKRILDDIA